ncbi:hypothetical protein [Vulcanisaeta distributa]|uniref:Uncharacterized protein n=1 Tax=Vulcanisaeta distributa (strain DSM 14429 / JCM 11212 / NBRC 100878 / IC-017) TaxID=572478 RepID=E1QPS1_VULDI|nr:hypothetical protein [Vulcanisaeta distributa]ADN51481.1 conserved hypothetical protein [Vulcanisaeta distributa DSM 14429]
MEEYDLRIIKALVDLVSKSRGKRVTIKARSLLKFAGLNDKHSDILKTAKVLGKLANDGYVRVESTKPVKTRSRVLRYIITESMELWKLAKENPNDAVNILLKRLRDLSNYGEAQA